jgi:membrane-associated protein
MVEYIIETLQSTATYVHFISFGLLLLAGFSLPISEDLVFIISASIAATIVPENTLYIFIGCFTGAYASDLIAFSIGRFAGPRVLAIPFVSKHIPGDRIFTITQYFEKYGAKTLFFGRFIPFGVRNVLFFTCGTIRMPYLRFMIIDFLALCVTSTILFSLGYHFGQNYDVIFPYLNRYKMIIFGVFIIILVLLVVEKKYNIFSRKESKLL